MSPSVTQALCRAYHLLLICLERQQPFVFEHSVRLLLKDTTEKLVAVVTLVVWPAGEGVVPCKKTLDCTCLRKHSKTDAAEVSPTHGYTLFPASRGRGSRSTRPRPAVLSVVLLLARVDAMSVDAHLERGVAASALVEVLPPSDLFSVLLPSSSKMTESWLLLPLVPPCSVSSNNRVPFASPLLPASLSLLLFSGERGLLLLRLFSIFFSA